MYADQTVRERFFTSLREEVLQIPDLPLISTGHIHSRVHQNEKEAMFERLLSHSIKKDADKFGEEKAFDEKMMADTIRNLDNFDERLRNSMSKYGFSSTQNVKLPKRKIIPEVLYKTIMNTKVEDRSLKFRGFVAVFDIKAKDFPIYDVKILQTVCSTYGFHIVSHKVLPFKKIKAMLYQKDCLVKADKVKRPDYEELFTNLEGLDFDDLMSDLKLVPRETLHIKNRTSSQAMARTAASTKVEFLKSTPGRTPGKTPGRTPGKSPERSPGRSRYLVEYSEKDLDSALIVCLAPSSGTNYHEKFGRMLEEKADLFAESLNVFYSSDDRKESFIDVQMFFPELFQVNFMTLINIPSKTFQDKNETDNKLEEMLNLNNFKVVKKFDAIITKDHLVDSFKDVFSNHINLAEFLLAESRIRLQITAKLGNMHLNDFGLSTENYIKILDQETNYNLYKHFFPETYRFSRVVLTIRPFLLKTGLDELFLNIFRLNGFAIVKRVRIVLTEQQALYLAKHERIEPEHEAHYISLMTDGECEIVIMSNYAAVEKAAVIIDGNNNDWTTTEQLFNVNLDEDNPNPFGSDANLLFKSIKDAISLGKAYDHSGLSVQSKLMDERIQLQEKAKLMKAFLSSSFNFAGFCSRNQETTEELISLFAPDCSKISNVYVILKPAFALFEPEVSALLERLGFKISEKKHQRLSPEEMRSLLESLEKNGDGSELNFEVEEQWDGEFVIYNIFKPAGKKEMLSLLRNFFLHANVKKGKTINKDNLYCYLVPCWSATSLDFIHQNIYQTVRVFDPLAYIHALPNEKKEIVNYILKTTVGDGLKEPETTPGSPTANLNTSMPFENFKDLEQFDTQHITIKAISNHHGEYQIRIRDFRNLPELFIKGIKEEYECINFYYSNVNRMYGQKCPSFYQYRVVPDDEEGVPNHIYDCQEYMGEFFLKVIAEEMFDHKMKKLDKSKKYNSSLFKSNKGSVAAYMYGSKLAVYIKKLEKIKPQNDLNGYGQVRILNGKPRGVWQFEDRRALEYQKYTEILSRLSHFVPDVKFDQIDALDNLIKRIFKSEAYKYSREVERLRVVPEFLNPQSLRIFKKPDNRDLKEVHEDYKTLNYDFETTTYGREKAALFNKDFALIYATPQVSGKYKLIANMLYLVEYEFSLLQKVPELAHGSMEEYNALLKGISLGLRAHHKVDDLDQNILEDHRTEDYNPIDFVQMELVLVMLEAIEDKLERFIQLSDFLNEEADSLQRLMQSKVENRRSVGSIQTLSTEEDDFERTRKGKNENIEKFHTLQDTLVDHIKQLISCLTKLDIAPSLEEKEVLLGNKVKITRDRYFKPLFSHLMENDVFKEKYKKNMTMYGETLVSKYRDAEFFQELDENQRRWLYAPDLMVYDIKKPKENKRGDLYVDPIVIPGEELEKEIIRNEIARSTHFKNIKK